MSLENDRKLKRKSFAKKVELRLHNTQRSLVSESQRLDELNVADSLVDSLTKLSIGEEENVVKSPRKKPQDKIQSLVDMGFSYKSAKKAVKATILSGELTDAIDYIMKHPEVNEIPSGVPIAKPEKQKKPSKMELQSEILALREALKEVARK